MIRAVGFAVFAIIVWAGSSAAQAGQRAWDRQRYDRIVADQAAYTQSRLTERGLTPLAEVRAQGRQVRQIIFTDPYMMISLPAVQIERLSDGRVTLVVRGPQRATEPAALPNSAWTELMAAEAANAAVFKTFPPYREWAAGVKAMRRDPGQPPPLPPPLCHGWGATIGAAGPEGARFGGAGECRGDRSKLDYVAIYARLAVSTRADCIFEPANPFWSFQRCFSSPNKPG